jgi:hypothetical protein
MRSFVFVCLAALVLPACSNVPSDPGLAGHPLDCAFGFAHADCAQGTPGHQAILQQQAAAQTRAANNDAQCRSYGAERGSPAYIQCRMNLDNLQAQDEQQRRALAVEYLIAHPIGSH